MAKIEAPPPAAPVVVRRRDPEYPARNSQRNGMSAHADQPPPAAAEIVRRMDLLLGCLAEALALRDEYDDEFVRPSPEAVQYLRGMAKVLAVRGGPDLPIPVLGVVGNGGLAVQWDNQDRHVYLSIAEKVELSTLVRVGPAVSAREAATEHTVSSALDWVVDG